MIFRSLLLAPHNKEIIKWTKNLAKNNEYPFYAQSACLFRKTHPTIFSPWHLQNNPKVFLGVFFYFSDQMILYSVSYVIKKRQTTANNSFRQ